MESDPRAVALRLATGRVQEEIQEATRREIELRHEGKDITISEETVDEKVSQVETGRTDTATRPRDQESTSLCHPKRALRPPL